MATITKGDLVNMALSLLRISGLTRQPTPEDMTDGLFSLEIMVLGLENDGLRIGYNKSSEFPKADPSEESGIRDKDTEAIMYMLAERLAEFFGKPVPPRIAAVAKSGYEGMFDTVPPIRVQNPYQPAGQGNHAYCYDRYVQRYMPADNRLTVENDGQLGSLTIIDSGDRND